MNTIKNALSIKGIKKAYKGTEDNPDAHALKGFDLNIPKGSMFALLGPNGAGKSTLINILAGLVDKTEGTVEIWGMDIDKDPRNSKTAIGIVPQEINVDPFFTPVRLLDLHAGLYGVKKSERRTEEILKSVGLWDKRNAYSRHMSGGMKRRMLIAKAMVHNPPILVLDEPTAGVDIELRQQLWANIKELNAKGTTIVLTTHYLEEAEELCDYIAVINNGKLVANGTKDLLLKGMDKKKIIITLDNDFNKNHTPKCVEFEKLSSDKVSFSFAPSKTSVGDVLKSITKHNYSIKDIVTEDADLEDLFLQLTSSKNKATK